MRLAAALSGNLRQMMDAEFAAAERGITGGIRGAVDGLKADLRAQVSAAGLGPRLARTWGGEVYPRGRVSVAAAGLVWSKAPQIVRNFAQGATIRSTRGLFLAIPTPAAGRQGPGGRRITPAGFERRTGLRLRFVYRREGPSLLVADNVRISASGRLSRRVARRTGEATVPIFLLVPSVTLRKRLDVEGAARRWHAMLPALIVNHWRTQAQRQG